MSLNINYGPSFADLSEEDKDALRKVMFTLASASMVTGVPDVTTHDQAVVFLSRAAVHYGYLLDADHADLMALAIMVGWRTNVSPKGVRAWNVEAKRYYDGRARQLAHRAKVNANAY